MNTFASLLYQPNVYHCKLINEEDVLSSHRSFDDPRTYQNFLNRNNKLRRHIKIHTLGDYTDKTALKHLNPYCFRELHGIRHICNNMVSLSPVRIDKITINYLAFSLL